MKPIIFHNAAAMELEAAMRYYDSRRRGLGQALLLEVERATANIQDHPMIGAPYKKGAFRRYVVRRFPYVLFYLELSESIWIAAVAHAKRRPDYWRSRSPKPG